MAAKFIFVYSTTGNQCFSKQHEFVSRPAAERYLREDFGIGGEDVVVIAEKQLSQFVPTGARVLRVAMRWCCVKGEDGNWCSFDEAGLGGLRSRAEVAQKIAESEAERDEATGRTHKVLFV